ncbi:MAG TPA: type VI secretion system baseplate subunit TssE [Polyangiales bacterium]|nr:type VI secretion system baseplate subunit TssE [Polyangiales bacterium]
MPELSHKHRLQPSLLDRLTDDDTETRVESHEARAFTEAQLKESVRRDLSALFNTTRPEPRVGLERFDEIRSSTLNFGIAPIAGSTLSSVNLEALARMLRAAIERFEPRLNPRTVELRPQIARGSQGHNAIVFEIVAELWAYPVPLALYLRSEIDLESGSASVTLPAGTSMEPR